MTPLSCIPGGWIGPENVVGREREVARYWRVLGRQSLVLSAERRIGKTCIVRKMHEHGRDGFTTIYQDLEHVHGVMEFVRSIYRAVSLHTTKPQQAKHLMVKTWETLAPKKIADTELPDVQSRWKALVEGAIRDTLDAVSSDQKVVFFWDEFPQMLFNIIEREEPDRAIELLDLLRALRGQFAERLRFVFTGSIGLHLVLRRLRDAGSTNAPTNDMLHEVVEPMAHAEAVELAQRLLLGLPLPPPDAHALALEIVQDVEGFPYYIHHTVDQLAQLDHHPETEDVRRAVDTWMDAAQDPANLRYFEDRITTYYAAEERRISRLVLTLLAKYDAPLPLDALVNLAKHGQTDASDELIERVVSLLRQDHYLSLVRTGDDVRYGFRWSVVKRWWRRNHR